MGCDNPQVLNLRFLWISAGAARGIHHPRGAALSASLYDYRRDLDFYRGACKLTCHTPLSGIKKPPQNRGEDLLILLKRIFGRVDPVLQECCPVTGFIPVQIFVFELLLQLWLQENTPVQSPLRHNTPIVIYLNR